MKIFDYDGYPAVFLHDVMEKLPIQFKTCEIHTELRYAGEKCPVCLAIEAHDMALGKAEYEITELEGRIDDLEQQVDAYRTELKI